MSAASSTSSTAPSPSASGVFFSFSDANYASKALIDSSSDVLLSSVVTESVLFGIYTLLIIYAAFRYTPLRNGVRCISSMFMIAICAVMYAMALAHWAISVHGSLEDYRISQALVTAAKLCINNVVAGMPCAHTTTDSPLPVHVDMCALTALLVVNILLCDLVVLWRCALAWAHRRAMLGVSLGISLTVFCATVALLAVGAGFDGCRASGGAYGIIAARQAFEDDWGLGAAAFAMSWVNHIWIAVLVLVRLGQNGDRVRAALRTGSWRRRVEKALLLGAESGLFYIVFWTFFVAYLLLAATQLYRTYYGESMPSFYYGMQTLKNSGLIDIIGIYATTLVVFGTRTYTYQSLPPAEDDASLRHASEKLQSAEHVPEGSKV